jgi:protein-L-isoaspartate O-methyltransferase
MFLLLISGTPQIECCLVLPSKGYPSAGPYHAIHVGAAAATVPEALVDQLAKPGRMFIPVVDPSGDGQ